MPILNDYIFDADQFLRPNPCRVALVFVGMPTNSLFDSLCGCCNKPLNPPYHYASRKIFFRNCEHIICRYCQVFGFADLLEADTAPWECPLCHNAPLPTLDEQSWREGALEHVIDWVRVYWYGEPINGKRFQYPTHNPVSACEFLTPYNLHRDLEDWVFSWTYNETMSYSILVHGAKVGDGNVDDDRIIFTLLAYVPLMRLDAYDDFLENWVDWFLDLIQVKQKSAEFFGHIMLAISVLRSMKFGETRFDPLLNEMGLLDYAGPMRTSEEYAGTEFGSGEEVEEEEEEEEEEEDATPVPNTHTNSSDFDEGLRETVI